MELRKWGSSVYKTRYLQLLKIEVLDTYFPTMQCLTVYNRIMINIFVPVARDSTTVNYSRPTVAPSRVLNMGSSSVASKHEPGDYGMQKCKFLQRRRFIIVVTACTTPRSYRRLVKCGLMQPRWKRNSAESVRLWIKCGERSTIRANSAEVPDFKARWLFVE